MKNVTHLSMSIALICILSNCILNTQDDLFIEDTHIDNVLHSTWLDQVQFQTTRSKATPEDIASLLVDIGALSLLQANIYRKTNPMNVRNVLDYPIHIPIKYSPASWITNITLFYNHTDRNFFTRTSDAISSYLGVCDPKLLEFLSNDVLEEIIRNELPNFNLDPLDVMPLFKNMTIQERRIGIMFHGMKRFSNNARFRFMFPVLYVENNFWLTEDEQRAVEARFGKDPNKDAFADEFLISDKVGVGDLRLSYDTPIIDKSFFHLRAGVYATIPVSFAFKRGLKGSYFKKREQQKPFDFVALFCNAQGTPAEKQAATQEGIDFFANAIKHLSANVIERPLGNDGHLGLGAYIRYKSYARTFIKRRWAENVTFNSHLAFEILTPAQHKRFYIEKSDQSAFESLGLDQDIDTIKERIENDPAYAQQVLTFFSVQMTEKFFPFALKSSIWPGCIFKWTSKAHYEGERWGVEAGLDTWVQAREKIYNISIPSTIPQDLNIAIARRPFGYQWKLFGSIFLKSKHNEDNWLVSISSDYTLAHTGIGGDYTIALVFERHF